MSCLIMKSPLGGYFRAFPAKGPRKSSVCKSPQPANAFGPFLGAHDVPVPSLSISCQRSGPCCILGSERSGWNIDTMSTKIISRVTKKGENIVLRNRNWVTDRNVPVQPLNFPVSNEDRSYVQEVWPMTSCQDMGVGKGVGTF